MEVRDPAFGSRWSAAVRSRRTPLIVGLDPRYELIPESLQNAEGPDDLAGKSASIRQFCHYILDVVAPLVPAVKPQVAFFEQLGPAGMDALQHVAIDARARGLLVIMDAKRNDIGSTADGYAAAYLMGDASPFRADALTVNTYLGSDGLRPFLDAAKRSHAGIFGLVKTSNPGSGELQDLICGDRALYTHVADLMESLSLEYGLASGYGMAGAVVGATYPEQLTELRARMPHCWLLVPGYGAQGGTAADVAAAFDSQGLGALINSSRAIIFAHRLPKYSSYSHGDWQRTVESATRDAIDALASETPAGKL